MILRDLTTLEDCRQVVELEKLVWGYTDAEDIVPVPILVVTIRRGGILIGAFEEDGRMAGFVYSLPAARDGRLTQWSHMLGVVDRFRNAGLGRDLKLAQRQRALAMGIDLIEWTFDPLQALNAHFNFVKLGIVAEEYEENIYGESSSPLHRGTPTDRLVAEWWIGRPSIEERIRSEGARPAAVDLSGAPAVIETRRAGRWLECASLDLARSDRRVLLAVPTGFGELQQAEASLARSWRQATREAFTTYLSRGYRAVDFVLDREAGRGHYVLEKESERLTSA